MKNILFFFLGISLFSCHHEQAEKGESKILHDSISYYYLESQDSNRPLVERLNAINKAYAFAENLNKTSEYGQTGYHKNWIHFSLGQYDSLNIYHKIVTSTFLKNGDYFNAARQYYLMGYYYEEVVKKPDSAFMNYNLSKGFFQKVGDSSWVGRNLLNMGIIQKDQNDFFGSKETLTEALQYLNPLSDIKYISSCYATLATNHRKLLNYEAAQIYYEKALQETDVESDKLLFSNNIATLNIDRKKYGDAITILNIILLDTLLIPNSKQQARVLDNLAYAKWLSGHRITKKEFEKPLKTRIQTEDKRGQIASYTHLGEYYDKKNLEKAKSYFDSVIQLSKIIKMPRAEKNALKFLMQLEPKSVAIRNRYVFLQDSLYEQETKVKTQFAKYKYDDKLKQEDILRLEKENAEKELLALRRSNQTINAYAVGLALFLLLGFLTYLFVQRSQQLKEQNRTIRVETTYETEAELSRKLHDDFGGKLNHAMLLLQRGANSSEVLDVVDELYNQSRDFSREINDVDTGPNFKNTLFVMMGNYCKKTKLLVTGSADVDWSKVPVLCKKTLYKVLQEIMINMQKHSEATLVSIAFEQTKNTVKVSYVDNGVGASKEQLYLKNGLLNTEKRIQAIGGTIIFESESETGFEAQIEIPN